MRYFVCSKLYSNLKVIGKYTFLSLVTNKDIGILLMRQIMGQGSSRFWG